MGHVPILQDTIPDAQVEMARRSLPKMQPVAGCWITVDEAYSAQLSEKERLLEKQGDAVLRVRPEATAALEELSEVVLSALAQRDDFDVAVTHITRPDGAIIPRDGSPLLLMSKLLQEDLCILQKTDMEHRLTAALLCFPASWTLAEKIGKPLLRIHRPVPSYTPVAARVQRLFDGVRPDRPMWRANHLRYDDPSLYQPRSETNPRPIGSATSPYIRSERQTVLRLPITDAVVFAIHTRIIKVPGQGAEKKD